MSRAPTTSTSRETPVTWLQSDGGMIEGVLDLAFEENGVTTVVDFKTDHELSAGESITDGGLQITAVRADHSGQLLRRLQGLAAVSPAPVATALPRAPGPQVRSSHRCARLHAGAGGLLPR